MRLLVLGAAGVVGSAVVREALQHGHEVHVLVRSETDTARLVQCENAVTWHRHDLEDVVSLASLIDRHAPHAIVQAAFPAGHPRTPDARYQIMQRALRSSLNVVEALRSVAFEGAVVYLGSAMAYGSTGVPHHPSARLEPSSFRGAVKAAESLLFSQFAHEARCALTELRLFTVYGPWEQRERLLPRLFVAALTKERVPLTREPHQRDWVYVDDVARACLQACERPEGGAAIYNVCSGQLHHTHEVARLLERITGRELIADELFEHADEYRDPFPLGVLPRREDGFEWHPAFDLDAGLRAYWQWAQGGTGQRYLLATAP